MDISKSNFLKENSNSTSSMKSIPKSVGSSNAFHEGMCGEPLMPQHMMMDFTPSDEVDTDFVQEKIIAFWDFISSNPKLHDLMAMPEYPHYNNTDGAYTSSETHTSASVDSAALSVLQYAEEKGIVDCAFEAHLPKTNCSFDSMESDPEKKRTPAVRAAVPHKKAGGCKCNESCKSCRHKQPKGTSLSSPPELKELCKTMQEWDFKHPKSMEPPGLSPNLAHSCLLQQKILT